MPSAFSQWTWGYALQLVRRELMDPQAKWWSDAELLNYANDWQNDLQSEFELVWGSATITTILNTLTLGTITPPMFRLDAVYYGTGTSSGYRLSGRLLQDLERMNTEWRSALPNTPREVIQYDSTQMIVWPPLSQTGTFIFEYPTQLVITDTSTPISLPVWTQWSLKPYVCSRAYLRHGPVNDLKRSLRYQAQFLKAKARVRLLWDNYLPERFRRLKPAGHYEWDILHPPPAWDTGSNGASPITSFASYIPLGATDGLNPTFTIPANAVAFKIYVNGILQTSGVDYTSAPNGTSVTVTFLPASIPGSGSELVAWVFTQGF